MRVGTASETSETVSTDEEAASDASRERFQRYIYHRYHRPLLRYVLPIVHGDRHFAEDVVQETLVRAWLHLDDLTFQREGPWLYAVAHHVAISSYYRRRRARPQEVPIEEASVLVSDEQLDRVLDASELRAAIRELKPVHRNAIVDLFYLQRSVAEVAAGLGIPAGTVRSRAFYALRELREILEQRGVTNHDL